MPSNGALDLTIRIMGKVDPSLAKSISSVTKQAGSISTVIGNIGKAGLAMTGAVAVAAAGVIGSTTKAAQTFESVDLSGVGDLCTMHEITAENRMAAEGFSPLNKDRNYLHAVIVASQATGLPEDFFTGLPVCEAAKLRNTVGSGFFE